MSSPFVVDVLDRHYRYKSVATQIPQDDGLAAIWNTGRNILYQGRNIVATGSTDSKHHALNSVKRD